MLGSSFAWGLAFTNIGMPSILGYMLSGVIIGPYFMNIIGDGQHNIESIRELGDLGLTILMFVTGMHLDINTKTSQIYLSTSHLQFHFSNGNRIASKLAHIFYNASSSDQVYSRSNIYNTNLSQKTDLF